LLTVIVAGVAAPGVAGGIDERVDRHIEEAVANGVRPADFHHLFLAFTWNRTLSDWTVTGQHLDRLSGVRQLDPLMADEIRFFRARFENDRGRDGVARELFLTMGGLSSWWFHGPESLEELADFAREAVPPTAGFQWRAVPGTDGLGWLRLSGLAWPPQRQMAYLATTVTSDREQAVAIRLGAAEVARIWLNGVEILTTPQPLLRAEDQAAGGGWLREGENSIVVAVASEGENWWLRARLTQPDGSPLEGVRELRSVPAEWPAVDREAPQVRDLGAEIRRALADGAPGASTALAAFLVAHRPEPVGGGGTRAACKDARAESPGEARLLEWIVTSEPGASRDLLSGAVEADPDLLWARLELAGWYGERGLYEQAHRLLLESDPNSPVVRGALLDLDAGLWGALVLPDKDELARAYPRCVRLNATLAELAIDARRWDVASAAVDRLEGLIPGVQSVSELRRQIAESCGDGAALAELLTTSLDRDPNQPDVRVRLARLVAGDDIAAARSYLEKGLERSPTNVDLMMELASIEHSGGDETGAAEIARQVLEIRPQNRRAQRLLELLGERTEDFDWMRTPEELWRIADNAQPATPAVMLLDHHEIEFLPSRLTEERVQQAFLITAADRADDLLSHHIPFVAETERLRVLKARIIRRDGSEVGARQGNTPRLSEPEFNLYYDTRLRVLRFSEFADGDIVEISYILTETEEANETGPYKGGLIQLGRAVPVAGVELELAGPTELLPTWELVHLEGEPERSEDADGVVHLKWRWQDLPPVPPDVPPAPPLLATPYLVFSNHPEWGDLADWYARHVAPRIRASEQVVNTARRLTEGYEDRLDQIFRLYRFVTNDIEYVGLEFGEHRFRPFSADWVLHHRIGDCKDKSALLVALLEAVGIPARMVMIRTADLGPIANDIALLEVFNHAIAYLPEDDLWLDGTASGHAMNPPPPPDQNAVVLVIEGKQSRLATSPAPGAGVARSRFSLTPENDGRVRVVIRSEDTGEPADRRRARFHGSRDPQRFARWLQEQFPGAQLVGEPKLQLVPGRDPTIVEIEGTVARSALQSAGGIKTYPGLLAWGANMVPGGERHGPLMVTVRPDLEWTLEVELGRPPKDLPEAVTMTTDFGELRVEAKAEKSGYRVQGSLRLVPGLVEASEVAKLREFLVAVERHLDRRLESP
jgi:transglutaminase-like putative cysteine protease